MKSAAARAGVDAYGGAAVSCRPTAELAQLVERNLAKVEVAGSSPVFRSRESRPSRPEGRLSRRRERVPGRGREVSRRSRRLRTRTGAAYPVGREDETSRREDAHRPGPRSPTVEVGVGGAFHFERVNGTSNGAAPGVEAPQRPHAHAASSTPSLLQSDEQDLYLPRARRARCCRGAHGGSRHVRPARLFRFPADPGLHRLVRHLPERSAWPVLGPRT